MTLYFKDLDCFYNENLIHLHAQSLWVKGGDVIVESNTDNQHKKTNSLLIPLSLQDNHVSVKCDFNMANIMMMMVLFRFDIYNYSKLKIFLLASRKNYVCIKL